MLAPTSGGGVAGGVIGETSKYAWLFVEILRLIVPSHRPDLDKAAFGAVRSFISGIVSSHFFLSLALFPSLARLSRSSKS